MALQWSFLLGMPHQSLCWHFTSHFLTHSCSKTLHSPHHKTCFLSYSLPWKIIQVLQSVHGGQNKVFGSQFPLSIMWILWIKFRLPSLAASAFFLFYLLNHLEESSGLLLYNLFMSMNSILLCVNKSLAFYTHPNDLTPVYLFLKALSIHVCPFLRLGRL